MILSRWTTLFALAASSALALPLSGCYVEADAFGEGQVEGETGGAEYYAGASKTVSVAYSAGMALYVESHHGSVRVVRGDTDTVDVTFKPFVTASVDGEAAAQAQIDAELDLGVTAEGEIVITAARQAGASADLGADIEVSLPAGFSGDFVIDQVDGNVDVDLRGTAPTATVIETTRRGDIRVVGAAGAVGIATAVGNVDVGVSSWSAEDGHVHVTESGNITLTVAAGVDGTLAVITEGGVISEPATMPSGWVKDDTCTTTEGTYHLGTGEGGTLAVWTHSGSVTLAAEAEVSAHASFAYDVEL